MFFYGAHRRGICVSLTPYGSVQDPPVTVMHNEALRLCSAACTGGFSLGALIMTHLRLALSGPVRHYVSHTDMQRTGDHELTLLLALAPAAGHGRR